MSDLYDAAHTAVHQCLDLWEDESIAIVTDDERRAIAEALYEVACEVTEDATFVQYQPGSQHGQEPPAPVAAAMQEADTFLAPTTRSLSHTRARSAACEAGARGATLPGITEEVMVAGLNADYEAIDEHSANVKEQVAGAEEVRVTAPAGTDITFQTAGREWHEDTGIIHDPGEFSNLPAGEVFVAPESAEGTFVVDGTMMPHGLLAEDQELVFEVEDGHVTHISDEAIRSDVEEASVDAGRAATNVAELGIGTNVGVEELAGSVLLDEKAAGTVHIAIGDNASIGGDVEAPIHLDGIIREPTVYADGEPIALPR